MGHGGVDQIAAGGVQHTLGLAGGAGGIEDEERILGVHLLGRAFGGRGGDGLVIPDVAALGPFDLAAGAPDHDHGLDVRAFQHCRIGVFLQWDVTSAAHAFVGGDDQLALGVEHAVAQRIGRETAEDDGMHGADARAGQHGDGGLWNHRQINADTVTLLHAA